ncbi:hypothetical protein G6M04_30285 [Agrobacterium rhizogenes]|uniref:hypothetical protein n=1 Tax=Rhizobium rhizogenes TaxID=359 RepID=UPI0015749E9C|nr:hypothetical protein [Rhizobium rhizogenes]NTG51689.1 hypothetical protein [Rhizobium rhizogenes]
MLGAVVLLPTMAHASGRLPIPPVFEEFKSHSACIAALEAYFKEDQKQVRPKSAGNLPGVELITEGVNRIGRDQARYGARMWRHHVRIHEDLRQTETSHSYEYRLRVCEGKTMQITGEDGYTSSTFEPLLVAAGAPPRLKCPVHYEDCTRAIAIVEATIKSDPALAALRQAIDARIEDLKRQAGVSAGASLALDEDEAKYRRSLRRDLYIPADGTPLAEEARSDLRDRLSRRFAQLKPMSLEAHQFAGLWNNASGELEITGLPDGGYSVSANPVDIDDLKWTCELSGEGHIINGVLVADLGAGEQLELSLRDGVLHSGHKRRETDYSEFCGAGGHGDGIWFSTRPQEKSKGLE